MYLISPESRGCKIHESRKLLNEITKTLEKNQKPPLAVSLISLLLCDAFLLPMTTAETNSIKPNRTYTTIPRNQELFQSSHWTSEVCT